MEENDQLKIIYALYRNRNGSISTPIKISARNPVCRLCGGSYQSHYMLPIFSKAGSTKDLCSKVEINMWDQNF